MITAKVEKLRKQLDKIDPHKGLLEYRCLSTEIFNELIENCKPTRIEFDRIANGAIVGAGSLYSLLMLASERWKK